MRENLQLEEVPVVSKIKRLNDEPNRLDPREISSLLLPVVEDSLSEGQLLCDDVLRRKADIVCTIH